MSGLTPEQGGRDYDHLLTEYRHLVADLTVARRERTASTEYAVRLEDALRRLYRAVLEAIDPDTRANTDPEFLAALAEARRVLPVVTRTD